MGQTVKLKRSTVAGKVPVAADLQIGELGLNSADCRLFTKSSSDNQIIEIGMNPLERLKVETLRKPLRIAVIGDSNSSELTSVTDSWPKHLEQRMNSLGTETRFEVYNFAYGGATFDSVNNLANFGGKTARQAVIDLNPDVVIVALGANKILTGTYNIATVKNDATSFYTALRAGLPFAKVYNFYFKYHDSTNATPATLLNKHVGMLSLWQRRTSGILKDLWSAEIQDDAAPALTRTRFTDLEDLNSHISSLSTVNYKLTVDIFKVARIGGITLDTLHLNDFGQKLVCSDICEKLRVSDSIPEFSKLPNYESATIDWLFSQTMEVSGNGWVQTADGLYEVLARNNSIYKQVNLDQWGTRFRARVKLSHGGTIDAVSPSQVLVEGAAPNATVKVFVNGVDLSLLGSVCEPTNSTGSTILNVTSWGYAELPAGSPTRLQIGDEMYGPFVITPSVSWVDISSYVKSPWVADTVEKPSVRVTADGTIQFKGKIKANVGVSTSPPSGIACISGLPSKLIPSGGGAGGTVLYLTGDPLFFTPACYLVYGLNSGADSGKISILTPPGLASSVKDITVDLSGIRATRSI